MIVDRYPAQNTVSIHDHGTTGGCCGMRNLLRVSWGPGRADGSAQRRLVRAAASDALKGGIACLTYKSVQGA